MDSFSSRQLVGTALLCVKCVLVFSDPAVVTHVDSRPNIILVVADDMGWGDMGSNWAKTVDTPNLDALAKDGVRLTDFHSGASVCAPSRAALLTGRLGLRTGVTKNFGEAARGGLPRNESTVAELLQAAGYRTAMLGKWHLGTQPGHQPLDKGFHTYLGVPYSVDMGCTDPAGCNYPQCAACPHENSVQPTPAAAAEAAGALPGAGVSYCYENLALPLYRDRAILHQPLQLGGLASLYAQFGTTFILNRTAALQPFFLYAALSHVHVPHGQGPTFANGTGRGAFADSLREMDWLVGELVAAARRSARTDTLLWFFSDNGPWEAKCSLAGSAGPFAGAWQRSAAGGGGGSASKTTVWEGGHRVPALLHWPGRVPPGGQSSALLSALDVLPTLAALAGQPLPTDRAFDGRDLGPLLLRSPSGPGLSPAPLPAVREVLFHPNSGAAGKPGQVGAVRVDDYKVVFYSGGTGGCDSQAAPARRLQPPLVFDLRADPAEARPLPAGSAAEAGARRRAARALLALAASVRADRVSRVDYSGDPRVRPCCDRGSPICRCPWD